MFGLITHLFSVDYWLGLLPPWVPITMVGIGLGALVISWIIKFFLPFFYRVPVYVIGLLLILGGSYVKGRQDVLVNAKKEIQVIVQKQEVITERVVTKYITKIKEVRKTNEQIQNLITTENDHMCTLPESFRVLHDAAAEGTVPNSTAAADDTPSGIALSDAERTIVANYGQYQEVAEQLKALQEWVAEQKKLNP